MHSFSAATPTHRGCTQLPLARYRLHSILKNGRRYEKQFHCLQFSRSRRQVDSARKNRQLSDLYVITKSLPWSQCHFGLYVFLFFTMSGFVLFSYGTLIALVMRLFVCSYSFGRRQLKSCILGAGWDRSHGLPALSRVWRYLKLSDDSLGTRPRYSLVVDEDVNKKHLRGRSILICISWWVSLVQ